MGWMEAGSRLIAGSERGRTGLIADSERGRTEAGCVRFALSVECATKTPVFGHICRLAALCAIKKRALLIFSCFRLI
ncbi:hypothetical protein R70331_02640 [Paenibacillus sp. FSL R7-0331]|nr:hypothetical protein R70331_02640 [Paenibacillus sp. FSL R7-0331]